jgi:hypothetical protein
MSRTMSRPVSLPDTNTDADGADLLRRHVVLADADLSDECRPHVECHHEAWAGWVVRVPQVDLG